MKKEHIELFVFDMAGTTIDEQNVVYITVCEAINHFGVQVDLERVLKFGAGKEKHQAIIDVLKSLHIDNVELAKEIFLHFKLKLDENYKHLQVKPVEGVDDKLQELRALNKKVVLNTGYNRKIATLLLDKLKWCKGEHYDMLITADDIERGRPHPDMIEMAMAQFGITNPSTVLKAGDSAIDIEEGKNANCGLTVGVLSGAQTRVQLEEAHPDYILESLKDL